MSIDVNLLILRSKLTIGAFDELKTGTRSVPSKELFLRSSSAIFRYKLQLIVFISDSKSDNKFSAKFTFLRFGPKPKGIVLCLLLIVFNLFLLRISSSRFLRGRNNWGFVSCNRLKPRFNFLRFLRCENRFSGSSEISLPYKFNSLIFEEFELNISPLIDVISL